MRPEPGQGAARGPGGSDSLFPHNFEILQLPHYNLSVEYINLLYNKTLLCHLRIVRELIEKLLFILINSSFPDTLSYAGYPGRV